MSFLHVSAAVSKRRAIGGGGSNNVTFTFIGANGTPVTNNTALSILDNTGQGGLQIVNNALGPANDSGDYQLARINNVEFGMAQSVTVTIGVVASGAFFCIVIRSGTDWSNHIRAVFGNGYQTVTKRVAGVDSTIGSDSFVSMVSGDTFKLAISSDGLTVTTSLNGSVLRTITLAAGQAPTGTRVACGFYSNDTNEGATITQFNAKDS